MGKSNSLVIGDSKYVLNVPELKLSALEARLECENQGMKLAIFDKEDQLPKISDHINKLTDWHEVWHVINGNEIGFIYKDLSRKMMPTVFVNSENIKVVAKYRDIALYSFVNHYDSESKELGNYICMTTDLQMSSTESYNKSNDTSGGTDKNTADNLYKGFSILGLLIGSVFFVVLLVSITLYFVHKKRNNRK